MSRSRKKPVIQSAQGCRWQATSLDNSRLRCVVHGTGHRDILLFPFPDDKKKRLEELRAAGKLVE